MITPENILTNSLSVFSLVLAGSTSAVAYLLDPAIKQLFIEQNKTYLYLIQDLLF